MASVLFVVNSGDAMTCRSASMALQDEQVSSEVMEEPQKARLADRLAAVQPDVVVSSLMMRFFDGYEVASTVEATLTDVPVILLTRMSSSGGPIRHWPKPFEDFVFEPKDHWPVVIAIEQALYRHMARKEHSDN